MQQTVTVIETGQQNSSRLQSSLSTQIASMSAKGWSIVSTVAPAVVGAPIVIFWRKE